MKFQFRCDSKQITCALILAGISSLLGNTAGASETDSYPVTEFKITPIPAAGSTLSSAAMDGESAPTTDVTSVNSSNQATYDAREKCMQDAQDALQMQLQKLAEELDKRSSRLAPDLSEAQTKFSAALISCFNGNDSSECLRSAGDTLRLSIQQMNDLKVDQEIKSQEAHAQAEFIRNDKCSKF